MVQFRENTQSLNRDLRRLQEEVSAGKIKWGNKSRRLISVKEIKGIADSFETIDQKLKKEAPTITYDGPFSDHIEKVKPKAVLGKPINESEAVKIAKTLIEQVAKGDFSVDVAGRTKGNIPAYTIEFTRKRIVCQKLSWM